MALDYLPSPGWAVIYGETPSATRWSELGDNDDSLATGAGFDDALIKTRHLGSHTNLAIPPTNLNLGSAEASVLTNEGTSSAAFTDLATAGPSITVTVGASGVLLVIYRAQMPTGPGNMAPSLSGANTYSPAQNDAAFAGSSNLNIVIGGSKLFTGLNAGSTTVTLKYKSDSGTSTFLRRNLIVIPLG